MPEDTRHGRDVGYLELLSKLFCRLLVRGVLEQALEEGSDLTAVQLSCLNYLNRHENVNASNIAEGLAISRAAATNLVERLVRKGLVSRQVNPEDRRQVFIRLLPQGKEVLDRALGRQREYFSRIVGRMKGEDLAALRRGLYAFIQAGLTDAELLQEICTRCGDEHMAACPVGLTLTDFDLDLKF
ncbi:MAG: MarR family transcriptional regulator [bacterium]|jgi:DNA-binding MarR family transcriptional regulator|nr:MarR family transcriptional regulator [Bacillota bacterium]HHW54649.1 MarR family transcriptional regulator [Bacillota bacterium]